MTRRCPYCGAPAVDAIAHRRDRELCCGSCLEPVEGELWTKYASGKVGGEVLT